MLVFVWDFYLVLLSYVPQFRFQLRQFIFREIGIVGTEGSV